MQFDEFKTIAKALKCAYTTNFFLPDEYAITLWYRMLSDLSADEVMRACEMHIKSSPKPPAIADIRRCVIDMQTNIDPWNVQWAKVVKAIGTYGAAGEDKAKACFNEPAIAAVDALSWDALCKSTNAGLDKSQFSKLYDAAVSRMKDSLVKGTAKDYAGLGIPELPVKALIGMEDDAHEQD